MSLTSISIGVPINSTLHKIKGYKLKNTTSRQLPGFLLRISLAGTMAFIAGTTCPDRITVRHIAMVLTVINVIDTQLRYIWAVIRYICSCWRFFLQMYTYKTRLLCRDRNKEKFLHVRRTCDHVRLTCPPIFSHVQKIMHRSTQNYKFRKTGTILNYFKIQQIVGRCCFM